MNYQEIQDRLKELSVTVATQPMDRSVADVLDGLIEVLKDVARESVRVRGPRKYG